MSKSTKITVKTATPDKTETLPKQLPIGVNEMGRVQLKGGQKSILVSKSKKCFTWRKNDKETIRFDLKTGMNSDKSVCVVVSTYKRDVDATVKALRDHRLMKLEAQQRYLSKQK